ncbi:COP9 signalosome complex subunit 3-like [Watersipora subatra]|uniref:COP9 signalosome complex subunit 3-like n=1 Tax=Watersipora subatra TaxID=2589382 RepID=UPI00355C7D4B
MAGVAEKFVNSVREFSVTPSNIAALSNFITKSYDVLIKCPLAHLDNALETLLPDQHAVGILTILLVKYHQLMAGSPAERRCVSMEEAELNKLITQTDIFVETCNIEHVRYVLDIFNEMVHHCAELLIERQTGARAIPIVTRAITRIREGESQLTALHSDLCHLCLCTKTFKPALPFLDVDITDIQRKGNLGRFDSKHFLLYYYYGGMIYAALKNFKRAAFFFEIAVSTPCSAVSAIMVESYKKYVLVHLLAKRIKPAPLKFAPAMFTRQIKNTGMIYDELASAYASSIQSNLQAVVDKHKDRYEQDGNYGLVKQCIRSLYKKNIQKLTRTFLTLSFNDVANRVHLASSSEAERYLLEMIEDEEIYATMNQKDGMVEFHDYPEKYNNPAMLAFLQQQERQCMLLNSKLSECEQIITVTPDYVGKVASYSRDDDGPKPGPSNLFLGQTQDD